MPLYKDLCPVPFDQQPLNEFYLLKKDCFFSFFGFQSREYIYGILRICLILIFLCTPLILTRINFSWYLFVLDESCCIIVLLSLVLIRLYLGWSYIVYRLVSSTVFYEESGWYDGQIWIKTPEILTKDRLIATYYVLPLLQRIKLTFIVLSLFLLVELCFYGLLSY